MKQAFNYYKIRWTALYLAVLILVSGLSGFLMLRSKKAPTAEQPEDRPEESAPAPADFYSNEDFSLLIAKVLNDLDLFSDISFQGEPEGRFILSAGLSDPEGLLEIAPDLSAYAELLKALKGETITVTGHLGEGEKGYGQFIADTVSFSGYTLPAAAATPYIDQYTNLNDLLAVPLQEITLTEEGIAFQQEVPLAIQIVSYSLPAFSFSASP